MNDSSGFYDKSTNINEKKEVTAQKNTSSPGTVSQGKATMKIRSG